MKGTHKAMGVILAVLLAILSMTGCEEEVTGAGTQTPAPDPQVLENYDADLAGASAAFGFDIFRELSSEEENRMISPTSLYTALAMTLNGARGETRDAMEGTLGVSGVERDRFNENNLARMYQLQEADPDVILTIANSLWVREGEELDPKFVNRNQTYYHALMRSLDFSSPQAADTINQWVSDRTEERIEKIVEPPINEMTILFLINAVYFKGDWSEPFDEAMTEEDLFRTPAGGNVTVPFMVRRDEMAYHEEEELFQAVRLPYGSEERLAMYVFLPWEGQTLTQLLEQLEENRWNQWRRHFWERDGRLRLPRFTMAYEKTMNDVLKAMGMEPAFDEDRADFFDMLPRDEGDGLFISEVKHKTFIEVNEKGTEAAAVTSVEMEATSAPPEEPFDMNVNRPFLFLIHDSELNEVLFMGTVVDPSVE